MAAQDDFKFAVAAAFTDEVESDSTPEARMEGFMADVEAKQPGTFRMPLYSGHQTRCYGDAGTFVMVDNIGKVIAFTAIVPSDQYVLYRDALHRWADSATYQAWRPETL